MVYNANTNSKRKANTTYILPQWEDFLFNLIFVDEQVYNYRIEDANLAI